MASITRPIQSIPRLLSLPLWVSQLEFFLYSSPFPGQTVPLPASADLSLMRDWFHEIRVGDGIEGAKRLYTLLCECACVRRPLRRPAPPGGFFPADSPASARPRDAQLFKGRLVRKRRYRAGTAVFLPSSWANYPAFCPFCPFRPLEQPAHLVLGNKGECASLRYSPLGHAPTPGPFRPFQSPR